jgi:hypothetical protein
VTLHPATLLFVWGAFVLFVQPLSPPVLAFLALILVPWAFFSARRRMFLLLRRTRWLLLSIAVLFVFATPGQRLPGAMGELGVTQEGILIATEYVLRLVLLLLSLALLHERLGTSGMMAGLYWLLAPLGRWREMRTRIVVRLMLVLDHVENAQAKNWRTWLSEDVPGPEHMALSVGSMRPVDWTTLVALIAVAIVFGASA